MHCKSEQIEQGIAASLYLIYKINFQVIEAAKQLSLKHLHIKYAKTDY